MEQSKIDTDYNYCNTVGQTDVGRKRHANEDHGAHFITCNGLVSVVCDGMGGHVGGAMASEIAITAIREFLDGHYINDPREAIGLAIEAANRAVLNRAEAEPALKGMGSTCVLLIVRDAKVYIGHVGDSRIYLIRERKILQLTKDHSFVQMLVDAGGLTPEQAEHHPRKNEITNALGIPNMFPATVKSDPVEPQAGDCFLLCSDGLSGMVRDREIEHIVSRQRELRSQERADLLIRTANEHGGVDNITVEMVEFTVSPTVIPHDTRSPIRNLIIPALIALFIVVGGVIAYCFWPTAKTIQHIAIKDLTYRIDAPVIAVIADAENGKTNIEFIGTDQQPFVLETETDFQTLESNLIVTRDTSDRIELSFAKSSPVDSVYLQIEDKTTKYFLVAKVLKTPIPIIDTTRIDTVTYEKPGEQIATLSLDSGSVTLHFTDDQLNSPAILPVQADPYSVAISPGEAGSSSGLAWIIAIPKSNSSDRITISFKAGDKTYVYIIPVKRIASVRESSVMDNQSERISIHKGNEAESKITVRKTVAVPSAKKGSILFSLERRSGKYLMLVRGKAALSFDISEIDETSVSVMPEVVAGKYDDGNFSFACNSDLKQGMKFQVSFRAKDTNGCHTQTEIGIEVKL